MCVSMISHGDAVAYVDCKMIKNRVILTKRYGEKLSLPVYPDKVRDFRKVWNYTVHTVFNLPNNIVQGVYRYHGTDTYHFAIQPGLPICIKINNTEGIDLSILILMKIYINGEEIKYKKLPGAIYQKETDYAECFDIVRASFAQLARGNLKWKTYKPLMKLKRRTEITYVIELYADKPLLGKNMIVEITIGPPYIAIQK